MSIQEIYASTVRPLAARDRLRLASLILGDLDANDIDVSDSWSDEDISDLTKFAARAWDEEEDA
jgi:hypothetical protein